jgi:hypothetical protein
MWLRPLTARGDTQVIHIDEIQTEVQVEDPARDAERSEPDPAWLQLARWRQWQQQVLEDDARTSAWGNEG